MSKQSNKVKFGLKNCHYAKATFDEDGSVTYAKPVRIPGAVSLSMDANGEIEPFYADNIAYYVVNNNSGYEGDLEIALIPESFLTDIMHEELDGNGVLAENANVELEHFAFLFEFDGDQRHIRHVLYNCTCTRPSVSGGTTNNTKEPSTETMNLTSSPLPNGNTKARTTVDTPAAQYAGWYDAVWQPLGELVVTSAAGATSGKTALTVAPELTRGNSYKYQTSAFVAPPAYGQVLSEGWTDWDGSEEITAEVFEAHAQEIFDEAENRLHAQKAVMVTLMK